MVCRSRPGGRVRYEIVVAGRLDRRWVRWFEGLELDDEADGSTRFTGEVDQAALHGLLNRLRDLGIELISVQRNGPSDRGPVSRRSR